jgi:hypothetical protein
MHVAITVSTIQVGRLWAAGEAATASIDGIGGGGHANSPRISLVRIRALMSKNIAYAANRRNRSCCVCLLAKENGDRCEPVAAFAPSMAQESSTDS